MILYCTDFECPHRDCPHHDIKSKKVLGARHTLIKENLTFCIRAQAVRKARKELISELPVPSESEEQQALIEWVEAHIYKYPVLDAFYHIPNEGKRSKAEGAKLKREGLKEGVSDNCLPVKSGDYGSLYMELKNRKNGKVSDAQSDWIDLMWERGNAAFVCYGWEEARDRIIEYLEGRCERGECI